MRYTLIFLLLSACASVPDNQTGTYVPGTSYIGPGDWGYAQGIVQAAGTSCLNSGYQSLMGPPLLGSYNCATPLLFYSRSPYYPYYSALAFPGRGIYSWRPHSPGAGRVTTAARISSGHGKKRK